MSAHDTIMELPLVSVPRTGDQHAKALLHPIVKLAEVYCNTFAHLACAQ